MSQEILNQVSFLNSPATNCEDLGEEKESLVSWGAWIDSELKFVKGLNQSASQINV